VKECVSLRKKEKGGPLSRGHYASYVEGEDATPVILMKMRKNLSVGEKAISISSKKKNKAS